MKNNEQLSNENKHNQNVNSKIYDCAVFGGGVVGTAVLNKLTRLGKKAILLEIGEDVCTGMSKANSAIAHAGFDAQPETLKAKLNVKGKLILDTLCQELSVPYTQVGAVVAGNDMKKLEILKEQGIKNGVPDLEIIEGDRLHKLVPNLKREIKYALYAPTSCIVNVFMLTIALAEEAVINGADFRFSYDTKSIKFEDDIFTISDNNEKICAKHIINSTGWGYNNIAKLLGVEEYPLSYRRGEYYVLDREVGDYVGLTVFPLPTHLGKGILATPTTDGNVLFGPTSENCSSLDPIITPAGLKRIKDSICSMFIKPPFNKAIREYAGIRVGSGNDFIIEKSKINPKVINLCGINSPGLTAAPAIAEMVCDLLNFKGDEIEIIRRKPYGFIQDKNSKQLEEMIKENPKFGNILCKCEMVSEAEILNAIHSPLKPHTLDSIKRRVRPTAGHCQGGFCMLKVARLISNELNIPLQKVIKETSKSYIFDNDNESGTQSNKDLKQS
ncbi:MAG: NAD(P)/FAD-dependent oxidoreductase [Clostridia bacterium]|nr:NAD(P)/FAD-dependent oxidoreductase [Clostridia bacterium]